MIQQQQAELKDSLISVRNLTFRYYSTTRNILDNVNLEIARGDIVLLAGKSGSGKSTLLRAINGLIPHQHVGYYSGSVLVDGLLVQTSKMSEIASRVGYIFQNPENQIFMFSVERDVAFGLENLAVTRSEMRRKVEWALDTLEISDLALSAPHELSDGQKQRVAIAGSIVMGQKIIILDEPTSLLDPHTAKKLIQVIKSLHDELGITILIVEHRLDLVSTIANRLVVIDNGRIAFDGAPSNIMYSTNLSIYGVTEPTIVRTAKLLESGGFPLESQPISVEDLATAITQNRHETAKN